MDRSTVFLLAFVLVAGILFGMAVSYLIWGESTTYVAETPKPEIRHADGSVTAATFPTLKPEGPAPTKPKGGAHVRTIEVTVLPKPSEITAPEAGKIAACPPVRVRVDIDRYDDGFRASVWSDGEILDTADYPIENLVPVPPKHGIGVAAFTDGSKQIEYTRFFKRVALSGYVAQDDAKDITAGIGAQFLLR